MADERLQKIVERMVAAGESEENIAAVIRHYQPPADEKPEPEPKREKSVGGFLSNLVSSAGRFVGDTVRGGVDLAKLVRDQTPGAVAQEFVSALLSDDPEGALRAASERRQAMVRAIPGVLRSAVQSARERYGTLEAAGDTLYTDPVGVLADVATVASLGSAGAATKAPRVARALSAVERATNPMQALRPAARAVEYATAGAVRPMLKPGKRLRQQQGSALEIERTALREGAVTGGLARRKQKAAARRADEIAAQAPGRVPNRVIADMPESLQAAARGLDHQGDLDRLAQVESEVLGSLPPGGTTASELLDKRRYLDRELNNAFRAAERGGAPTTIRQRGQQEVLGNIRRELRNLAPEIAEADDATRRLSLVRSAIEDAGLRAGDIPMGAALVGAGGAAAGLPGAGTLGALFGLGRTFPQIPLAVGTVPVQGSALLAAAGTSDLGRQAGIWSRLFEIMLERELAEGSEP